MIGAFRKAENGYIECFSAREDRGDHILFRDEKLPDMHAFNMILIKESMKSESAADFVSRSLNRAKTDGRDFLKITIHPETEITNVFSTASQAWVLKPGSIYICCMTA